MWRKAFSAIDLVKELLEGLSGGGGGAAAPPPPPNFDPMAVYNNASGPQ